MLVLGNPSINSNQDESSPLTPQPSNSSCLKTAATVAASVVITAAITTGGYLIGPTLARGFFDPEIINQAPEAVSFITGGLSFVGSAIVAIPCILNVGGCCETEEDIEAQRTHQTAHSTFSVADAAVDALAIAGRTVIQIGQHFA